MEWEWEDKTTGLWSPFGPNQSRLLDEAYTAGDPFQHVQGRQGSVSFCDVHGIQINLDTETSRPIRRVHAHPVPWEARVSAMDWLPFEANPSQLIEDAWNRLQGWNSNDTSSVSIDLDLQFDSGHVGSTYRISFCCADGVWDGGGPGVPCVRRTSRPLQPTPSDSANSSQPADNTPLATGGSGSERETFGPTIKGVTRKVAALSETCCVCLDDCAGDAGSFVELTGCGHGFHLSCISKCFEIRAQCPLCLMSYGMRTGNQPPGQMTVTTRPASSLSLEGYPAVGTIIIQYEIFSGIQGVEHPRPGERFDGTTRFAYLPDNQDGGEVLRLLRVAFERRLLFTVGQSSTTGADNVVTWSSVHHKTRQCGGPSCHGWPDPGYFARVKEELRVLGVS